jgi:hypothetical protein
MARHDRHWTRHGDRQPSSYKLGRVRALHHKDDMGGDRRALSVAMDTPPHNMPPRYNICATGPVEVATAIDGKAIAAV